MASLLALSFDGAVRSQSQSFRALESVIQQFKSVFPEGLVDYYDLHQEEYTHDYSERFSHADVVLFICSFRNLSISAEFQNRLLELKKHELHLKVSHVFLLPLKVDELSADVSALVQNVFALPVITVTSVSILTEEFLALDKQT